jgi:hypothetical protein
MSRHAILAGFLVLLGSTSFAGAQQIPQATPSATTACSYNFSANSGYTLLKFCVTVNGNISQLETGAAGWDLIQAGGYAEGYGVCNESPAQAYWDYASHGDSGNWNPPTTLSLTTKSVKIARNTSDGFWTLTQTFTLDKPTPAVKVVMALTNNTSVTRRAYLVRAAAVVVGGHYDATNNSAFGWQSTDGNLHGFGFMLSNAGPRWVYTNGFSRRAASIPNPCAFADGWTSGILTEVDGTLELAYVGDVRAGATKTATMVYRSF